MIAVVLARGSAWKPGVPLAEQAGFGDHVALVGRLLESGVGIEAGPFSDPESVTDDDLVALALLDLDSIEDGRAVFAKDAIVADGVVTAHVHQWGGERLHREGD